MDLGWCQPHFVGVVVTGFQDATQDVAQLGFVVEEAQQRFAACALHADAEDVFASRVEVDDQQVVVDEDDARTEAVKNAFRDIVARAVVARTGAGSA